MTWTRAIVTALGFVAFFAFAFGVGAALWVLFPPVVPIVFCAVLWFVVMVMIVKSDA